MIYLYGYICYLKTFDRPWELSLSSCYLNSIILSLFMNFKTLPLGKPIKLSCCFKKSLNSKYVCKTKCALIIPFNNNY